MKTSSLTQPLLLALIMFVGHSMAWSQCLVYNHSYKYSESGFKSHSGSYSGYIVLGPKQIMQDALTRYPIVTFDVYSDKTGKSFSHYDNTPTDGTPSSGGLLIGLVKQGSSLMLLATEKSAGQNQWDWNPFDEETVSGTASYKNGYGYIASTLSATYSGWFPNYYYYTNSQPIIGNSTSSDPVNVYKWTASETYALNVKLTTAVAGMTFDQARDVVIQQLKNAGYKDSSTPQ